MDWASLVGAARDLVADVATAPRRLALVRAAVDGPAQRVLAISVARPERAGSAAAAAYELERSHVHTVDVRLAAPRPGAGKWENLNALLEHNPPSGYDWLIVFDDDVILPHGFLDAFLLVSGRAGLTLAQPAHKHWSHAAGPVSRRRAGGVVRKTWFAQIGPVTAIHAPAFDTLLPFAQAHPGVQEQWRELAAEHGWTVGIVDATPIRQTHPIAAGDGRATAEAQQSVEFSARG